MLKFGIINFLVCITMDKIKEIVTLMWNQLSKLDSQVNCNSLSGFFFSDFSLVAFHNHILFNPKEKKMLYRILLGKARSSCVSMIKISCLILMRYINSIFLSKEFICYIQSRCAILFDSEMSFSLHFGYRKETCVEKINSSCSEMDYLNKIILFLKWKISLL